MGGKCIGLLFLLILLSVHVYGLYVPSARKIAELGESSRRAPRVYFVKPEPRPHPVAHRRIVVDIKVADSKWIHLGYEIVPLDRTVTPPSNSGWVKVYGYIGLKTDEGYFPLDNIYVEAWDRDVDSEDFLASTRTDASGYFEMEFDNTDGYGFWGNQDIFLRVFLDSPYAIVMRNGETYVAQMIDDCSEGGVDENTDGKAISIYLNDSNMDGQINIDDDNENEGLFASSGKAVRYIIEEIPVNRTLLLDSNGYYYVSDPRPAAAARILWYIKRAVEFVSDVLLFTPNVTYVEFSNDYAYTHYYTDGSTRILYVAGHLSEQEWVDMDPIIKEYAKKLLELYAGIDPNLSSGNFTWSEHQDEVTAFVEGLCAFFSSVYKQYYGYANYTQYVDTLNGVPKFDADLEKQYDDDRSRDDQDVIGAVAGILWDFYDDVDDDQDGDGIGDSGISLSFRQIWDIIVNDKPTTIFDFVWAAINRYNLNVTKVWELCWEHGVNIDHKPPTKPTITYWYPQTGTWVNQSWIFLNWTPSTDDISMLKKYVVRIISATTGAIIQNVSVSKDRTHANITVGNGIKRIQVVAIDRAENENASDIVGDFMIDITLPELLGISYPNNSVIYDNRSGIIWLNASWSDRPSGVEKVYIRFRIGSQNWTVIDVTLSNDSGTYYYAIGEDVWKNQTLWGESSEVHLYWESICVDKAGNVRRTGTLIINLIDDDSDPPTIIAPECFYVYDNYGGSIRVWVNITDPSGVTNVTFEVLLGSLDRIYDNSSDDARIYANGDEYYIIIDRTTWIGHVGEELVLIVHALDMDGDRPGDQKSRSIAYEPYLIISDDDPDEPYVEAFSNLSTIYDNYSDSLTIWVNLTDDSGIYNVTFRILIGNSTLTYDYLEGQIYRTGNKYYVELPRDTWIRYVGSEITLILLARDNDTDRDGDRMLRNETLVIGEILDDDPNPPKIYAYSDLGTVYDSYDGPLRLWVNVSEDSGIYNISFIVYFGNDRYCYNNSTIRHIGDMYYVELSQDVWINYVGVEEIWLIVDIQDGDNDRPYDRMSSHAELLVGEIKDDDQEAPVIWNVSLIEMSGGDGIVETDENFTIVFLVNESSGIENCTVTLSHDDELILVNFSVSYLGDGMYRFESEVIGPLTPGGWTLNIFVRDNDTDRLDDRLASEYSIAVIEEEVVRFETSAREVRLNYTDYCNISFVAYRDDLGAIRMSDANIIACFEDDGIIIYPNITFVNDTHIIGWLIIQPEALGLGNGEHVLTFEVHNDYLFPESARVFVYVYIETSTSLVLSSYNVSYGQILYVTVMVNDSRGIPACGGKVTINILNSSGDTLFSLGPYDVIGGIANISWRVNLGEGNYTLVAIYDGSAICYYSSSDSASMTSRRASLVVQLNPSTGIVFTDGGIINMTIMDEHGNPAAAVNVTLYIWRNGEWEEFGSNMTDDSGIVTFEAPQFMAPGAYDFLIVAEEDWRYYGLSEVRSITVERELIEDIVFSVNVSYVEWGDWLEALVHVYDDEGDSITDGTATLWVQLENGSIIILSSAELVDGHAEFFVQADFAEPPQRIRLYVNVSSPNYYPECMSSRTVYLEREDLLACHPKIWEVTYGEESSLTLRFSEDDNGGLADGVVVIYVDEVEVASASLADTVELEYPFNIKLLPGSYSLRICVLSEYYELYNGSKILLKIYPIATRIVMVGYNGSIGYGDNITVIASVLDSAGTPVEGAMVSLYVATDEGSERICHSLTNASGMVVLTGIIELPPGNYTLYLEASPPSIYATCRTMLSLSVMKEKTIPLCDVPTSASVGDRVPIKIRIIDDEGSTVGPVMIELYVDDYPLTRTVCHGYLEIVWIPDSGGKHRIVVRVLENSYFEGSETTVFVNVRPAPSSNRWVIVVVSIIIVMFLSSAYIVSKKVSLAGAEEGEIVEELEELGL